MTQQVRDNGSFETQLCCFGEVTKSEKRVKDCYRPRPGLFPRLEVAEGLKTVLRPLFAFLGSGFSLQS